MQNKSIKNMMTVSSIIDEIIKAPTETPSREDATKILRSCGILDENNNIKSEYKEILIEN